MATPLAAPGPEELASALGPAVALWAAILALAAGPGAALAQVWKPSKGAFGRVCLLQEKKRTLVYLTPDRGSVGVAIILGERAYQLALHSQLPVRFKDLLRAATPCVEGRGIRFSVASELDLPALAELLALKRAPK